MDDAQSFTSSPSRSESASYKSASSFSCLESANDNANVETWNSEDYQRNLLESEDAFKEALPMDGYKSLEKTFARRKKRENKVLVQNEEELIDEEEKNKRNNFMVQGIKKFNTNPQKGIDFLVEHEFLHHTPENVARV